MRAKNLGRPSPSNMLNVPKDQGMYKWKSDHALDQTQSESSLSIRPGYVYDDSLLTVGNHRPQQFSGMSRPPVGPSAFGSPQHRHKTHSNSSSPSPSKDSGVSGMYNGTYRTLPQGSDASLMERLLSNENVKQREVLGKIIHLLRDEFAFDGYMENGVEDVAMAEYIASLGFLKWETFKSAICEKYSDLYWGSDLLCNLYNAVNGSRPGSSSRNVQQNMRRSADVTRSRPRVNDDDSSGMSEPGDTSSIRRRERDQLPPFPGHSSRPQSAHITSVNKQPETSDSTDSERYPGKRRRPRRKHELDKIKSSSSGNLITVEVPASQRKIPLEEADTVQIPAPVTLPTTTTVQPIINKPPSGSQQNSATNNSALSLSGTSSPKTRPVNVADISPKSATSTSANHLSVNGVANQPGQGQRLQREVSLSSHSSSQSDLARDGEVVAMEKKGHVVYHWTMIQMSMSSEMERFMQDIDEENHKMLLTKLSALEQQIKMEKRMRKKTQKFYKNLVENVKNNPHVKGDKNAKSDRNQMEQVASDITEMTQRIFFIDLCKTHIQMLLAELQGIDVSYLYSIAVCLPGEPLQLHPKPDNPLLQFQNIREPHSGLEIQALHAGTPEGLMAYLFASTALSEGYIHQFLFCFRYLATSQDVLAFLIDRYVSATKAGSTETNIYRLQQRVIDLLHFWLEGYYSIDFQGKPSLVNSLRKFIKENVKEDSDGGKSLLGLLSNCSAGNILELSSADPDESEMHFWQQEQPKVKWESFKSLVRGKSNAKTKVKISAVVVERRRHSGGSQEHLSSMKHMRRSDTFLLSDYTVQCLAEQLCLIEQGIFQLTHPVHYLNSKSQGVGVALTMKGMRTPAPTRRNEGSEVSGLFLESLHDCSAIQRMIDHAQEVSHWVAGEIVGCSNNKVQLTILSKFLLIAQTCVQLRNFATSMAILDGLENLIVKQLPAWKNLHSKCAAIMEELNSTRMFLKNDPLSLMQQGKDCHLYPTIPSAVLFLLHIQQLEIGGFKLANQMFKWGKIRSIAQVIDQVRIFREHMYGFESNDGLQDILRNRIHDLSTQDIHTLAEQHDINYHKLSSGSGITGALKKMKGKLSAK